MTIIEKKKKKETNTHNEGSLSEDA
ncbi:hypothetical protein CP082626L3_0943A, partial [Chlamydia psittaci 08-2626_L3]